MTLDAVPLFWLLLTVAAYGVSRALYRRWPRYLLSPLLMTPAVLLAVAVPLHVRYADYAADAHYLALMLGPATVAFAVPIWQQRRLLARHWLALLGGMLAGSAVAVGSSWWLASLLSLDGEISRSLVPRSVTTPFAMPLAESLGGVAELAAIFVMLTGVLGALCGGVLLRWLPLKTALARGALFGVGAHGAGVARAREVGGEEGTVAGLVMVLMGLLNLAAGPVLVWLFV